MKDLNFIGRKFDQICFVVEDLEAACEMWGRQFGITAWSIWEDLADGQTDKTYFGKPGDFRFSCAYGFAGDMLIELARHDGGTSVYKDFMDQNGSGPHHIGFRVSNAAEYAEAEQAYLDMGIEKAMGAYFTSPDGTCRWGYFDTRETIGCFTELYWYDADVIAVMDRIKAGEKIDIRR